MADTVAEGITPSCQQCTVRSAQYRMTIVVIHAHQCTFCKKELLFYTVKIYQINIFTPYVTLKNIRLLLMSRSIAKRVLRLTPIQKLIIIVIGHQQMLDTQAVPSDVTEIYSHTHVLCYIPWWKVLLLNLFFKGLHFKQMNNELAKAYE